MWSLQQQLASSPPSLQTPFLCAGRNPKSAPFSLQLFREQPRNYKAYHHGVLRAALVDEIPPNAFRRKLDPNWRGGFSLGVDLGMSRTGLALSKGFSVRPLSVLKLRGEKLEVQLLEIAQKQVFLIAAAHRGWRVYLLDEHGTTREAVDRMICMGLSETARQNKSDAYAAMMVLERYFSMSGEGTELVLPKNVDLQERLRRGPARDIDFFPEE
ncbi:uncharacterized protein LOC21385222 [Morus notabilis]|uniref:uncharacterized protein LOC21385222 n=1 Tax=Morus notabilis TaxID=981085 RepID=UPI000CED0B05|nr:uncharacterized protein LOC21385222 [Morus notabilis]